MKTCSSDVYTVVIERGATRCNEIACTEHMGEELWQTAKDEIIPQLEEISSDYQIPLMIITKMALKKICEWAQLAQPRKINKKGTELNLYAPRKDIKFPFDFIDHFINYFFQKS